MSSAPPASAPPGASLRRSLGVVDGVAIAASSTAATTSIAIGMGSRSRPSWASRPRPSCCWRSCRCSGIATAYARLNRVEPNCGNGYVWVGKFLGPWLGFLTGWVTLVGSMHLPRLHQRGHGLGPVQLSRTRQACTASPASPSTRTSTGAATAVGIVVLLLAVTLTAVTGIRSAARFQFALLVFEYVVLLGFCG